MENYSRVVFFQKNLTASPRQQVNYFLFFFFLLKIEARSAAEHNLNAQLCQLLKSEPTSPEGLTPDHTFLYFVKD